jgi:nucleotide-binding universal stress UspA family protein
MHPQASPSTAAGSRAGSDAVFGDVVVGIDETHESLVAAAQAGVLRAPGGRLVLVAVAERYLAAHAGLGATHAGDQVLAETSTELARAQELVEADDAILESGRLVDALCAECSRRGATLIAVGVRPHRRLGALTFGGHDVDALHDAQCSVLIARPGWGPAKPERIVVAVDDSPESRAAEAAARSLAARLDREVVPVLGLADDVDPAVLRAERDDAVLDPGSLAEAVAHTSNPSSLVVVGRGRDRGSRWGGGLVERVVYSARGSVLVVVSGSGTRA